MELRRILLILGMVGLVLLFLSLPVRAATISTTTVKTEKVGPNKVSVNFDYSIANIGVLDNVAKIRVDYGATSLYAKSIDRGNNFGRILFVAPETVSGKRVSVRVTDNANRVLAYTYVSLPNFAVNKNSATDNASSGVGKDSSVSSSQGSGTTSSNNNEPSNCADTQTGFTKGVFCNTLFGSNVTAGGYFLNFYRWAVGIAILGAAVAIVFAGYKYAMSRGNPSEISTAKEIIVSAIVGLVLLLLSFTIARFLGINVV